MEKAKEREIDDREQARMRTDVQYEPSFSKKKTVYNNHNQISIVGNGG